MAMCASCRKDGVWMVRRCDGCGCLLRTIVPRRVPRSGSYPDTEPEPSREPSGGVVGRPHLMHSRHIEAARRRALMSRWDSHPPESK